MRRADTQPVIDHHPLGWQTLAAVLLAGALLAIPSPVAAEPRKEAHAVHPVSPAIQGLLIHPRPMEQASRLAPAAKGRRAASHPGLSRKQVKGLPKRNLQAVRQEAAFARRVLAARQPAPDRPQKPRLLEGWQIRSIDGDTFAVGNERFRIRGLNAPESNESGGFSASQRLDLLLHGGPVLVIPYGQDTYGRTLAEVYVNNRNVADVMKEEGHDKQR